jgi:hypothetical protein
MNTYIPGTVQLELSIKGVDSLKMFIVAELPQLSFTFLTNFQTKLQQFPITYAYKNKK